MWLRDRINEGENILEKKIFLIFFKEEDTFESFKANGSHVPEL